MLFNTTSSADLMAPVASPPLLNINFGEVEILDDDSNPRYGLEYRFSPTGKWHLVPALGFSASENDAAFIYAEIRKDMLLEPNWLLTLSFGPGYFENGNGLDLGLSVEFRSGIELAYRFDTKARIALGLFHLSNGSFSDKNPGTEALVLSFMLPMNHHQLSFLN